MTSLAQTARLIEATAPQPFADLSPQLQADIRAFESDLADRRERIEAMGRELADIRARLGGGA